jgi:hypothetical protein
MGFKKFYADFKMGLFIFVSSSFQKLEPKNMILFGKSHNFLSLFSDFLFFKTHFRIGRHENKEKHLFDFSLRIVFPSIKNCKKLKIQKIQKLTSPTVH